MSRKTTLEQWLNEADQSKSVHINIRGRLIYSDNIYNVILNTDFLNIYGNHYIEKVEPTTVLHFNSQQTEKYYNIEIIEGSTLPCLPKDFNNPIKYDGPHWIFLGDGRPETRQDYQCSECGHIANAAYPFCICGACMCGKPIIK